MIAKENGAPVEKPSATPEELIATVKLGKVAVDGESASAPMTVEANGQGVLVGLRDPVRFRRIGDRWYCDIDPR